MYWNGLPFFWARYHIYAIQYFGFELDAFQIFAGWSTATGGSSTSKIKWNDINYKNIENEFMFIQLPSTTLQLLLCY